jgi:phospholipid/cholesterol/gamma-HCH transport system substrate-binding protein
VDEGAFWSQMQAKVDFRNDILNGVIKSVVFGVAVTWIAVFEGYDARPTAEGVSERHHAHRRHVLARDPRARFRADCAHVYRRKRRMNRATIDIWVGAFVAAGFAGLLFLALKVGNMASFSLDKTYDVQAKFANIGGLKPRAPIKSAGVVVGRVSKIQFDNQSYEADVTFTIDAQYQFPRDTSAKILTPGFSASSMWGWKRGAIPRC